MKLEPKQKLTILAISEWMAHTTKQEIEVVDVLETPEPRPNYVNGPIGTYRYGAMKLRGKRKLFHLDIRTEALVFDGWDLPIKIDSEIQNGFSGNACYNLGGMEPDELRTFIEARNLNGPTADDVKAKCILVRPSADKFASLHDSGELLWPEIETRHAVIGRMKEKLAA